MNETLLIVDELVPQQSDLLHNLQISFQAFNDLIELRSVFIILRLDIRVRKNNLFRQAAQRIVLTP